MLPNKHPLLKAQPLIIRAFVHFPKPPCFPSLWVNMYAVTVKLLIGIYLFLQYVHLNVFIEHSDIY